MSNPETINKFSEIYLNYVVAFGSEDYDPEALRIDTGALLGSEYVEIVDAEDKPEGAWGYRNSDSSVVIGYTAAESSTETPSSLVVVARVYSEDAAEKGRDINQPCELIEKALGSKSLLGVNVDDTSVEITLYYNPFKDEVSELGSLIRLLMPDRVQDDEAVLNVFSLSYGVASGVYTKTNEYSYASNRKTGKRALSVEITIQREKSQRTITDAIRDFRGIDVASEIDNEAKYLEEKRKAI